MPGRRARDRPESTVFSVTNGALRRLFFPCSGVLSAQGNHGKLLSLRMLAA
jgi:hypothetical protein